MLTLVLLVVSLAIILAAAELFTNAVEWTGRKLSLNEGVVGSVLGVWVTGRPAYNRLWFRPPRNHNILWVRAPVTQPPRSPADNRAW